MLIDIIAKHLITDSRNRLESDLISMPCQNMRSWIKGKRLAKDGTALRWKTRIIPRVRKYLKYFNVKLSYKYQVFSMLNCFYSFNGLALRVRQLEFTSNLRYFLPRYLPRCSPLRSKDSSNSAGQIQPVDGWTNWEPCGLAV